MFGLNEITGTQRLFTYKVAHDGGSAPNPFHGLCTLAICKPAIRRVAKKDDVILGLGCGNDGARIVYCMVVDAVVSWAEYIKGCQLGNLIKNDKKYQNLKRKIPKSTKDQGDCIWRDAIDYSDSLESWSGHGGEHDFNRDVKNGENVLLGEAYWYFGKGDKHTIRIEHLEKIIPGRGHRSNSNNDYRADFVKFFNEKLNECDITMFGELGTPTLEPGKADKQTCSLCCADERESDAHGEES
jgi:hypothetical protein